MRYYASAVFLTLQVCSASAFADWPQAAGPNHNYQVKGAAPISFSVARNDGVIWRTPLPNTGESAPVIANGRVFVTCHAPITADAQAGREILGLCLDAQTGKELWRRTLPASRSSDMASGFSDNTAASPVTDGKYVCFINVGGSIRTYDFEGRLIWKYDWVPFGRHHARQQEPILYDGKVIFLKTVAKNLPVSATTKSGAKPLGRGEQYWTRLHAVDLASGKMEWVAEAATSVHSASLLNRTPDGKAAILTGRGGGHQPPEEPYGLSLLSADTGKRIWDLPIRGYAAHQNAVWRGNRGAAFVGMQHHLVDLKKGEMQKPVSIAENVHLRLRRNDQFVSQINAKFPSGRKKKPTTYHTNCLVGDYHYFRSHNHFYLGRVNITTGKVEYLQAPAQVVRHGEDETVLWDKTITNDVKNNDGFVVCQDKRAKLSGWGHVSAASPIVVGDYLYMPTMVGAVYVIRWNAKDFDESALVSVGDLGTAGETWTLASLAYDNGRLYAHTLKELICIGK